MTEIYTIGYEGSDIEQLIATLKVMNIKFLADVRELPLSRKKFLSKNGLAAKLEEAGIEYGHFRQLGDPKPGRDAAKSGDMATFRRIFKKHLQLEETQDALQSLLEIAKTKKTCMMCFERCQKDCHRSFLADSAVKVGFDVFHLVPDRPEKYLSNDFRIPSHNSSKSLAAAK